MKKRYTSKELFRGIYMRDTDIIGYINDTYWKDIVRIVESLGGTKEDMEDLFQDTIESIYTSIDEKEPVGKAAFRQFFKAVAKNAYLKRQRRMKLSDMIQIEGAPEPAVAGNVIEDREAYNHCMKIVRQAMQKLKALCRKIIELVFLDFGPKEIAPVLGLKEARVSKEKKLCLDRLVILVRQHKEFRRIEYIDSNPVK